MHKLYNDDGKLRIIEGMSKDEALNREKILLEENKHALTSSTATDEELLRVISYFSQNSICFYPQKLFLDEAVKRGLDVEELVSSLPLLNRDCLFVPKGAPLWGRGKNYRVF